MVSGCLSWTECRKTKDMRIDFRHNVTDTDKTSINGQEIEVVTEYLGSIIDDKLCFESNTSLLCKQRLYCLRKLAKFNVDKTLDPFLYVLCWVGCYLLLNLLVWVHHCKTKKNWIWRLIMVSICITGSKQKGLDELYQKQMLRRVESILSDSTLQAEFQMLTSGSRFKLPKLRTNRYKHSFVPAAILLLNSKTKLIDLPFIDCLLFIIVFSHACKVGNLCIGCVTVCDLYYTICCTMNCPTGDK